LMPCITTTEAAVAWLGREGREGKGGEAGSGRVMRSAVDKGIT
jgi:hypothetical protein